jgi:hypothetical protein
MESVGFAAVKRLAFRVRKHGDVLAPGTHHLVTTPVLSRRRRMVVTCARAKSMANHESAINCGAEKEDYCIW